MPEIKPWVSFFSEAVGRDWGRGKRGRRKDKTQKMTLSELAVPSDSGVCRDRGQGI